MPSPHNPADVPASWLSSPSHDKPAAYTRAVARKVKNNRHRLVLDMATWLEDECRRAPAVETILDDLSPSWWRKVARAAGHENSRPSPATVAAVIEKVRADLAEPYRAKGRG